LLILFIIMAISSFFVAGLYITSTIFPYLILWLRGALIEGIIMQLTRYEEDEWTPWVINQVTYRFQLASGEVVVGCASVSERSWGSLQIGQSVKVRYMPSNPKKNMLAGYYPRNMKRDGIVRPLGFIVFGIALILLCVFR
jgi:hypothetical protein